MVINATGWNELMEGKVIQSVFTMYDGAFSGWFVGIIFFTFQILLYMKTRNNTITWVLGILFASLYASTAFMNTETNFLLFVTLSFQLAGILLMIFIKKR